LEIVKPKGLLVWMRQFAGRFACPFPFKARAKKAPCVRLRVAGYLFRSSCRDDLAALIAPFGAESISQSADLITVKIVFNHEQRSTALQQLAERAEQFRDVVEMQTGRRLIENVENALIVGAAEMRGELSGRCASPPESVVADCPRRK